MYLQHVKSYGDTHDCDFDKIIKEMATDYGIPDGEIDYNEDDLDVVLSMMEETICEQGIEYYCDWNYNHDNQSLEFNVFRILVSSEEELLRYCEVVRKEFTVG